MFEPLMMTSFARRSPVELSDTQRYIAQRPGGSVLGRLSGLSHGAAYSTVAGKGEADEDRDGPRATSEQQRDRRTERHKTSVLSSRSASPAECGCVSIHNPVVSAREQTIRNVGGPRQNERYEQPCDTGDSRRPSG
jgi:hypothetical protein